MGCVGSEGRRGEGERGEERRGEERERGKREEGREEGVRNSSDGEQERCLGKVRGGRTQSRDGDY